MHTFTPLANGLRTDHPLPDLPFVDDTHIPVDDAQAIEAAGRGTGEGMWGRYDEHGENQWLAFTTDPYRHDLAWCVRYHPDHGRSVLLYRNEDASSVHMDWWDDPLLFRNGGYWWDGTTWYRPGQIWDPVYERYERHRVTAAVTVTAHDLIDGTGDPAHATVIKVSNIDPDTTLTGHWRDHLALWAHKRAEHGAALPLSRCVVTLAAPELAGDQLVGVTEMAKQAGIASSTLRAYISRDEGDVPPPQATPGGRNAWSRAVVADWVEQRRRSPENVAATLAGDHSDLSLGQTDIQRHFAQSFLSSLWSPTRRKRWALRHRTEPLVAEIADELGRKVAKDLDRIIPSDSLAITIRYAILRELADDHADGGGPYHLSPHIARMLDWFVRHYPTRAQRLIGETIGVAERSLDIPAADTADALRRALVRDSKLEDQVREEFLSQVLPAKPTTQA
ncbi:helix-turn-helix transcriptional regulator [Nocardiopsis dassonvillei]|uniref:helix-turn-helix transcriptional regulator n=1 Tax=Nocardiopsis dassonvillei TaxID=2014 RepID=UPI00366F181B